MNRRVLYALALLCFGLMVGLIIGHFWLPERDGLVPMILFFLGGLVTGVLSLRAWSTWRGTPPKEERSSQPERRIRLGAHAVTVSIAPTWWRKFQERWFGVDDSRRLRLSWDAHLAQVQVQNAYFVLGALGIGIVAQLLILRNLLVPGLFLYAIAGIVFLVWMRRQHVSLSNLLGAAQIGRQAEVLLFVLIVLAAFGMRMVQIGHVPVGIDGDELKWTAQIYYNFVANEKTGDFAGQQHLTPVSFYINKVAFDLFGVDFNSPRIMTALLSVLATFVFYFVARDMFNVSVALIATLFMATSYWDVNTSRQAVVQTFTKLPLILALFLVIRGVDRWRWFYFVLCGFALYVGIMTYDTFIVVPPVIVLYVLFRGALDWRKWYRWLFYLALLILPMLLAYPIVSDVASGRQFTYFKDVGTGVSAVLNQDRVTPLSTNTLKSFAALFQELQGGITRWIGKDHSSIQSGCRFWCWVLPWCSRGSGSGIIFC